jgi:hypothetical protein
MDAPSHLTIVNDIYMTIIVCGEQYTARFICLASSVKKKVIPPKKRSPASGPPTELRYGAFARRPSKSERPHRRQPVSPTVNPSDTHTSTLLLSSQRLPLTTDHDRSGPCSGGTSRSRRIASPRTSGNPSGPRPGTRGAAAQPYRTALFRIRGPPPPPLSASDIYMASGLDLPPRDG